MEGHRDGKTRARAILGRPEPLVLIAALAVVLGALTFAKVADEVSEPDQPRIDDLVLRWFRHADDPARVIGPAPVAHVVRDISSLGGTPVLALVVLFVSGFLLLAGRRGLMWRVLLATGSGTLVMAALKGLFARPRPDVVPHLDAVSSYSFPSGHSMLSAVVYLTLGVLIAEALPRWPLKLYALAVAALLTGLVGVSRMMLGVHYPTDVLAGWAAGLVWAFLWFLAGHLARLRVEEDMESG